jgi:hypothetical protein
VRAIICISTDLSYGVSLHDYAQAPAVEPKQPTASVEIVTPTFWPPGVGSHKLTSTVTYLWGLSIALAEHDCGKFIFQLTIPPDNTYAPILLIKSSRKVAFSASTVSMDQAPVACVCPTWPPFPFVTCGDPTALPMTLPYTNFFHKVSVGVTPADLRNGWLGIGAGMAADLLTGGIEDEFTKKLVKSIVLCATTTAISYGEHVRDASVPYKVKLALDLGDGVKLEIDSQWGSSDTSKNPNMLSVKGVYAQEATFGDKKDEAVVAGNETSVTYTHVFDAGGDSSREGEEIKVGRKAGTAGYDSEQEVTIKDPFGDPQVSVRTERKTADGHVAKRDGAVDTSEVPRSPDEIDALLPEETTSGPSSLIPWDIL